eukprot:scaffold151087_cov18-Prasinocladus_malaysianus.AAC.1
MPGSNDLSWASRTLPQVPIVRWGPHPSPQLTTPSKPRRRHIILCAQPIPPLSNETHSSSGSLSTGPHLSQRSMLYVSTGAASNHTSFCSIHLYGAHAKHNLDITFINDTVFLLCCAPHGFWVVIIDTSATFIIVGTRSVDSPKFLLLLITSLLFFCLNHYYDCRLQITLTASHGAAGERPIYAGL